MDLSDSLNPTLISARDILRNLPFSAVDRREEMPTDHLLTKFRFVSAAWYFNIWPDSDTKRLDAILKSCGMYFGRDAIHPLLIVPPASPDTSASEVDAAALKEGKTALEIAAMPLWPGIQMPELVAENWDKLKPRLPEGEDWDVWVSWYEDRLHGTSPDKRLEKARVLIPDEDWQQGSAHVNAIIAELIDRHNASRMPQESELEVNPKTADIEVAPPRMRQEIPGGIGHANMVRGASEDVGEILVRLRTPQKWQEYSALGWYFERIEKLLSEPTLRPERFYSAMDAMERSIRRQMTPAHEGGMPEISDSDDTRSLLEALGHAKHDLRHLYPDLDAMIQAREHVSLPPPPADVATAAKETVKSLEVVVNTALKRELDEDVEALDEIVVEQGPDSGDFPLPEGVAKNRIYRLLGRLNQIVNLLRLPRDRFMKMMDGTAANIQRFEKWHEAFYLIGKYWPVVRKFITDMISPD